MAAKLTPQQIVDKQIRNASGAVQSYRDGVNGTDKNPMQLAVAKQNKLRNSFNAAVDSGKWAANTLAVSQQAWKNATAGKGADRYVDGVTKAKSKMLAFQSQIAPFRAGVAAELATMPTDTPDQRISKMVANAKLMSAFKFNKGTAS